MNTNRHSLRLLLLSLLLLSGTSSCGSALVNVTIQDIRECTVSGGLGAGMGCTHLLTADQNTLTFNESIDLLNAQVARTCVPAFTSIPVCKDDQSFGVPVDMPARGASFVIPGLDMENLKTELEIACRDLGKHCSLNMQTLITNLTEAIKRTKIK